MTPREIVLANVTHDGPERVGLNFSGDRIDDFAFAGMSPSQTYRQKRWTEGEKEYYDDAWGNVWVRMIDGSSGGEVFEPAIKDWSQLNDLKLPDFDDPQRYETASETFARPTDRFRMFALPGWVFDTSRYLRKMEVYLADLIGYPDEIHRLHEIVTGLLVKSIHLAADSGAEGVFYCEDLGTQDRVLIGPRMWREVFRPHYERLTGAAHERGMKVFMHSCGYNWQLLDDLIEAGIDCFQFDQPAAYDMPALAEKLRRRKVGLWSPVDIQKIMPTGDRALIEAGAREMVETFRGGLIMKCYPSLPDIGVEYEWDMWAYNAILEADGVETADRRGS